MSSSVLDEQRIMGYLSLRVYAPEGGLMYETDFGLQELIPWVRHLVRRLELRPDLAPGLAGYRAVITPGYGRRAKLPAPEVVIVGTSDEVPTDARSPEPARVVRREDRSVSYGEELQAFFNPGTSSLCRDCPDRHRCPGAGMEAPAGLDGWIVLDPRAPRTDRAIGYLSVRIEAADGTVLHREEAGLDPLEPFVMLTSALLRQAGRLPWSWGRRFPAEIVARHNGVPVIDPMLAATERLRLAVQFQNLPQPAAATAAEPPPALVDWDSLDEDFDLDIQLLATESCDLPRRSPPKAEATEARGLPRKDGVQVYLRRQVLAELVRGDAQDAEGLLLGEAFLTPEDARPWIDIVGLLPAATLAQPAGRGAGNGGLGPSGGEKRTLGWYRNHRAPEVHLATHDGRHFVVAAHYDRLAPTPDERFFHLRFFQEPWHVGLIVAGRDEDPSFYRQDGDGLVACGGFMVLD